MRARRRGSSAALKIVLATSLKQPDFAPSDRLFADALRARGADVAPAPWNGSFAPFADADAAVVRSPWDYPAFPDAFAGWLDRLGREARRVFNPPALMSWNLDKAYLLELAENGARLPATAPVDPEPGAIAAAMDRLGLAEAVIKRRRSGGAMGLTRARRGDLAGLEAAARALAGPGLVQALIPEIATAGETSLVYFGGRFSHAIAKRPKPGSILVQVEHGGSAALTTAPAAAIAAGRRILDLLPGRPLYARVDVVLGDRERLDGRLWLMEVEVIEPELFLTLAPRAADRFADALLAELKD
jgi:hypothetical protein